MDTQRPQMETPVTYRVVFLRSGVFQFVRYVGVPLDQVEHWAYCQLKGLRQAGDSQIWAAVIEAGYFIEDPYNRAASPTFLPAGTTKRGVLLDPSVLDNPLVSVREIFALDGSVFL